MATLQDYLNRRTATSTSGSGFSSPTVMSGDYTLGQVSKDPSILNQGMTPTSPGFQVAPTTYDQSTNSRFLGTSTGTGQTSGTGLTSTADRSSRAGLEGAFTNMANRSLTGAFGGATGSASPFTGMTDTTLTSVDNPSRMGMESSDIERRRALYQGTQTGGLPPTSTPGSTVPGSTPPATSTVPMGSDRYGLPSGGNVSGTQATLPGQAPLLSQYQANYNPDDPYSTLDYGLGIPKTSITPESVMIDPGFKWQQEQMGRQLEDMFAAKGRVGSTDYFNTLANSQQKMISDEYNRINQQQFDRSMQINKLLYDRRYQENVLGYERQFNENVERYGRDRAEEILAYERQFREDARDFDQIRWATELGFQAAGGGATGA